MFVENKPKETAPEGTHTGILYSVVDLGTQENAFDPDNIKYSHRIRLDWELSEEKMADGRPFSIGREYTVSWHPKAELHKLVKTWQSVDPSKGYDISTCLGKAANISVAHNDKGYAHLTSVTPLKKSEKAPTLVNPLRDYWIAEHSQKAFEAIPAWLQEKIKISPEYKKLFAAIDESPF